jgi:hypothetical protein
MCASRKQPRRESIDAARRTAAPSRGPGRERRTALRTSSCGPQYQPAKMQFLKMVGEGINKFASDAIKVRHTSEPMHFPSSASARDSA